MTMRIREAVGPIINDKMNAVDADVICEDGLMQRVCTHGLRHPVGHIHRSLRTEGERNDLETRHERPSDTWPGFFRREECCGCCEAWAKH